MNPSVALVAAGRCTDTYLLANGRIVKLYHAGIPPVVAHTEVKGIQAVQAAGIKTPAVLEVVEYQNRFGIVFERLEGPTMLESLIRSPERAEELARQLAALHADLHTRGSASLPSLPDVLRPKIAHANDLSEPLKAAALAALDTLPRGSALCHGDFHPGNVILTATGPVIIDWLDVTAGFPAADVARTLLVLEYAAPAEYAETQLVEAVNAVRSGFLNAYWHHYAALRPADADQVAAWMLPVAAASMANPVPEGERQALLALVERLALGR